MWEHTGATPGLLHKQEAVREQSKLKVIGWSLKKNTGFSVMYVPRKEKKTRGQEE